MNFSIETMQRHHIDQVYAIEAVSFPAPWPYKFFLQELANPYSINFVVCVAGRVAGYACCHHVVNEGHICNIAVGEEFRKQGIGHALLDRLVEVARERAMIGLTLEVAVSNTAAQALYLKHGFTAEGLRKNYYTDTKEDAIIMWKWINTP